MPTLNISLKAEEIFKIFGFHVTNSLLTTWIVMLFLVVVSVFLTKKMTLIPGRVQLIGELIIGGLFGFFESILGEKTKIFFPLVGTLFIFILFLNWFGLLPGVGSIGFNEMIEGKEVFIPLLRAGSADLNTTLAFGIIAVAAIEVAGIRILCKEYIKRFFNFESPIYLFAGLLELVGEGTKIVSFAFRLFGNIFAGEVLLAVVSFIVRIPVIIALPFIGLELFVGFIQALVFSMLTSVFLSLATTTHEH